MRGKRDIILYISLIPAVRFIRYRHPDKVQFHRRMKVISAEALSGFQPELFHQRPARIGDFVFHDGKLFSRIRKAAFADLNRNRKDPVNLFQHKRNKKPWILRLHGTWQSLHNIHFGISIWLSMGTYSKTGFHLDKSAVCHNLAILPLPTENGWMNPNS